MLMWRPPMEISPRLFRTNSSRIASFSGRALSSLVASPLLQPPSSGEGPIELSSECKLDLALPGVPTISIVGPSRRGKSVLACLLGNGDPKLFAQSHSSFRALTSGTHVCEIASTSNDGYPLRIVDTEGISHIGRSRKAETLVRQFLISTYLTSSCFVWLDNEVLSSNFFNMMWLVHDYVVDVLRVRNTVETKLPQLMYIRTQETPVQKLEYSNDHEDFASFFSTVLAHHEDAAILKQMFAPDSIQACSLPVWTVEDLQAFEATNFWSDAHASPFKSAVKEVRGKVTRPIDFASDATERAPIMTLGAVEQQFGRIAKLQAFDPRDHENDKVTRLREHLRATYGAGICAAEDGFDLISLLNLFDPEDADVRRAKYRIDDLFEKRLAEQCRQLRLEVEVAEYHPEIKHAQMQVKAAAEIFAPAVQAFGRDDFTEESLLHNSISKWHLDADKAARELKDEVVFAEQRFQAATGYAPDDLKNLNMYIRFKRRIEDCVMRLSQQSVGNVLIEKAGSNGVAARELTWVWRIGAWGGKREAVRLRDSVVWTDGVSWQLCQEKWDPKLDGGSWIAVLKKQGELKPGEGSLPLPLPPKKVRTRS